MLESCTFLDFLYTYLRLVSFAYGRRWPGSIRGMIPHAIPSAAALFFCKSRLRGHTKHTQERKKKKKKKKTSNDSDTDATRQFLFHATGTIFVKELYYCMVVLLKKNFFIRISKLYYVWAREKSSNKWFFYNFERIKNIFNNIYIISLNFLRNLFSNVTHIFMIKIL